MKKTLFLLFALAALTGCMTEREYKLRQTDLEARKAHAPTYQPLVLQGPLSLEKGASLAVTVPSQPYQPPEIPSDAESIRQGMQQVTGTAAILGGAMYGIHKAGDNTKTITTTEAAQ